MTFYCTKKGKNNQKNGKKRAQIPNPPFLRYSYDKMRHTYCPYET